MHQQPSNKKARTDCVWHRDVDALQHLAKAAPRLECKIPCSSAGAHHPMQPAMGTAIAAGTIPLAMHGTAWRDTGKGEAACS